MSRWSCAITRGNNNIRIVVSLAVALTFFSGQTANAGAEPEDRPASELTIAIASPLRQPIVGERLGFHGRWLGIPVGYGWLEVKGVVEIEGRRAYHIAVEGHSNDILSAFYPIHDVVDSYLDVETLQPLRFEKHQHEGHYRSDEIVTFDQVKSLAKWHSLLHGNTETKDIPLPSQYQDIISAIYWFRAQPIHPNETVTLDLYTDEKIYQTWILVKDASLLELLKRGTFPCLLVELKAAFKGLLVRRGRIWGYITTDEHRLPLYIKVTTPWGPMSAVIDDSSLQAILKTRRKP